ncbi:hypothetical protein IM40_01800 [Candidatus Paracaedimonas acanthamoebae]|nr:hypothetical protein IM40_01800 [Candidatus Paracaedimonas acanthamoebae]
MTQNTSSKILRCPVCKSPRQHEFRPFCSARCKQIDLNRWLSEVYSFPVEEEQNPIESQEEGLK